MTSSPDLGNTGAGLSLRERNRRRLREEIGLAARALFLAEGYGNVSVERVAEAAGVSARTVFRHFPRKEDLVFFRHTDFVRRLDELLAATPEDVPSLDALARALAEVIGLDDITPEVAADFERLLEIEPELRRYEEQLTCDHRDVIASFLRRRLGDAPDAWMRAELLAGAFTGTLAAARRHVHRNTSRTPVEHFSGAIDLLRALPFP